MDQMKSSPILYLSIGSFELSNMFAMKIFKILETFLAWVNPTN